MNATKITILASFVLILSLPAWGATKYGDASIIKGKVIVLRAGKRLTFDSNDRNVQINHQDVVRLGQDSSMVLSTVEKATITLGSNAVLHVKSWQRREQKGFFRMLFGRMRAKISGLVGNERFNVRSATATIGVKGTEETLLTNVRPRRFFSKERRRRDVHRPCWPVGEDAQASERARLGIGDLHFFQRLFQPVIRWTRDA